MLIYDLFESQSQNKTWNFILLSYFRFVQFKLSILPHVYQVDAKEKSILKGTEVLPAGLLVLKHDNHDHKRLEENNA